MTRDEFVDMAINKGCISVDTESGVIYKSKKPGGQNRFIEVKSYVAKAHRSSGGYLQMGVCFDGMERRALAHRIVWIAANGVPPNGLTINHINGIKTDNRIANLELITHQENMTHAVAHLLTAYGEKNARSKVVDKDVTAMRMSFNPEVGYECLCQEYGLSPQEMHKILSGRTFKHVVPARAINSNGHPIRRTK